MVTSGAVALGRQRVGQELLQKSLKETGGIVKPNIVKVIFKIKAESMQ